MTFFTFIETEVNINRVVQHVDTVRGQQPVAVSSTSCQRSALAGSLVELYLCLGGLGLGLGIFIAALLGLG